MDFLELAARRYSVRSFRPERLAREDLDRILKAGHLAPTACNRQPQKILVADSKEALEKLSKCTYAHFGEPCALLVGYDKNLCWKREFDGKNSGDIDASIVCTHMMLEAASIGVGTTWVMHFIPEAVRAEFEVPENIEITAILMMGYPTPDAKPSASHGQFKDEREIVYNHHF